MVLTLLFGIMASSVLYAVVWQWEDGNRQHKFHTAAQSHHAMILAGLTRAAEQLEHARFIIDYAINVQQQSPSKTTGFMPMAEPLIAPDSAVLNVAWGLVAPETEQPTLRIIYNHKKTTIADHNSKERTCQIVADKPYPHSDKAIFKQGAPLLQAHVHQGDSDAHSTLQLLAPVANTLQQSGTFSGQQIGAVIAEWDIETLIENALANTPVEALDIHLLMQAADGGEHSVFYHASRSRSDGNMKTTHLSYTIPFEYAGASWKLRYEAAPKFLRTHPITIAWQVLLMGILLTLFFAWFSYRKNRHMQEIEQQVEQRTQELKQSEEHFKRIVYSLQDIYYRTDTQGIIQDVSPSISLLSYSVDDVMGTNLADYYAVPKEREELLQALQQSPHGRVYNHQIEALRKDGQHMWISTNSQFIVDDDGNITGVEGTLRDITEERVTRRKLQHLDRVESLGVLAGGIAHDFNNILTAILGNATLAHMEAGKDSPTTPYLEKIERASGSAADLCKQMLAYAGKGKYVVKPVNLSRVVENMIKLIEVSIDKNVVLKYHLHEQLPCIDADTAQMQQLTLNLITNASEAIEGKSGVVSIATGVMYADDDYLQGSIGDPHLEPGRYVYMEVSDTGCGMDADMQQKIFDPFFTTKFTGRGLGMSAMRGIVRGHHGAMRIYSELGKGTTIKVAFPISQAETEAEKNQPKNWQGSGMILVIDDDENIREVAALMLERMGHEVMTANDGQHGIDVFLQHKNDIALVLLDMTMPIMNGSECLSKLRDIRADIPVILSSGYTEEDTVSRFTGKNLSGFVQKPYTADALGEAIEKALNKQ